MLTKQFPGRGFPTAVVGQGHQCQKGELRAASNLTARSRGWALLLKDGLPKTESGPKDSCQPSKVFQVVNAAGDRWDIDKEGFWNQPVVYHLLLWSVSVPWGSRYWWRMNTFVNSLNSMFRSHLRIVIWCPWSNLLSQWSKQDGTSRGSPFEEAVVHDSLFLGDGWRRASKPGHQNNEGLMSERCFHDIWMLPSPFLPSPNEIISKVDLNSWYFCASRWKSGTLEGHASTWHMVETEHHIPR